MSLQPGSRLGPHEIVEPLGAGGMGEVYKARDTRLERLVAIKILPAHLSANPALRQRLEREARAVSSLSHPHICSLYDIGRDEGIDYLVMEFLEGETLQARLERGALPTAEALSVAIQIADALDKAHKQGVIHRDLKPGNIMLTKAGAKLLDFGLAKSVSASGDAMMTASPTMTTPLTAEGTIIGTFQYMAPEQLEGQEADARTDVFAFGAVLYEMFAGHKAFTGPTQASLIASILKEEPRALSAVQPLAPPALDRLIRTCMEKDPEQRRQTMHDVLLELRWIAEGGSQAGVPLPVAARRRSRERLAWALAAVCGLAALALAAVVFTRSAPRRQVMRFDVAPPAELIAVDSPKISPDGRYLAYSATDESGVESIWLRPVEALTAQRMAGTEGTSRPFWSPDGKFLAFFAGGKLKKVRVSGGPPQTVCEAVTGADGSWGSDGVILFDGNFSDTIQRVPASGGVPALATRLDEERGESFHGWPHFLPDGRHFLFVAYGDQPDLAAVKLGRLDSEETTVLANETSRVEYSPPGYLLFARESTLMARPFDAGKLQFTGEPFPIADEMGADTNGLAHFSVSANGVLAYMGGQPGINELKWLDREGHTAESISDQANYGTPALSPDENRLAMQIVDSRSGRSDVWLRDLERGVTSRFTFDNADDGAPLWSPDGSTIVWSSNRTGGFNLYRKHASGSRPAELFYESPGLNVATSWSPDGAWVIVQGLGGGDSGSWDLWAVPASGQGDPLPVAATRFNEIQGIVSPDGRWIAYSSGESGRLEVYVQAFPEPGGKWQVSTDGGSDPRWRGDGKELLYRSASRKMTAVEVDTTQSFRVGQPRVLFDVPSTVPGPARNRYVMTADARRFLFVSPAGDEQLQPVTLVFNWDASPD